MTFESHTHVINGVLQGEVVFYAFSWQTRGLIDYSYNMFIRDVGNVMNRYSTYMMWRSYIWNSYEDARYAVSATLHDSLRDPKGKASALLIRLVASDYPSHRHDALQLLQIAQNNLVAHYCSLQMPWTGKEMPVLHLPPTATVTN